MNIDAKGLSYRELNERVRRAVREGVEEIRLTGVNGQRFIGAGLADRVRFTIEGVPGNDLAAFMDGPQMFVSDNVQDGVGNTMNSGTVVVRGSAGDVLGYGMRGGRLYIGRDAGYRAGIHMKSFGDQVPVIVIGGGTGDFLGEYMAGGVIIVLGLNAGKGSRPGNFIGTGMHGGMIYVRGGVELFQLGKEVAMEKIGASDRTALEGYLAEYCRYFNLDAQDLLREPFMKLWPHSTRPYGKIYAH